MRCVIGKKHAFFICLFSFLFLYWYTYITGSYLKRVDINNKSDFVWYLRLPQNVISFFFLFNYKLRFCYNLKIKVTEELHIKLFECINLSANKGIKWTSEHERIISEAYVCLDVGSRSRNVYSYIHINCLIYWLAFGVKWAVFHDEPHRWTVMC